MLENGGQRLESDQSDTLARWPSARYNKSYHDLGSASTASRAYFKTLQSTYCECNDEILNQKIRLGLSVMHTGEAAVKHDANAGKWQSET
jgi:hypothetical protein